MEGYTHAVVLWKAAAWVVLAGERDRRRGVKGASMRDPAQGSGNIDLGASFLVRVKHVVVWRARLERCRQYESERRRYSQLARHQFGIRRFKFVR